MQSEVEEAIKEVRDKKATGNDDVPGDLFKLLGEDGLRIVTQLIGKQKVFRHINWTKCRSQG